MKHENRRTPGFPAKHRKLKRPGEGLKEFLIKNILIKIPIKRSSIILMLFFFSIAMMVYSYPSDEMDPFHPDGFSAVDGITPAPSPSEEPNAPKANPVQYRRVETEIDGEPLVMFVLELNLSDPGLRVFPVLAQDDIFGFETLSVMNGRYKAYASVNAGFNYSYGQPAGLVVQNGKILSGSMGYGRTLLIGDQKAWFHSGSVKAWLEQGEQRLAVDRVNPYPAVAGILVFTPEYGPTDRIDEAHTVCRVRNNRVESVEVTTGESEIPDDGFLITDMRIEDSPLLEFAIGREILLRWDGNADHGYQCSGSLVEQGLNVAEDKDPWGGNMRIRTPRTAVGIKDESTLVFLVVDGRQPGYSVGATGKQLADLLISFGVREAALLDGGASSEMIVQNQIVNRPSTGTERLIASAFIISVNQDGTGKTASP